MTSHVRDYFLAAGVGSAEDLAWWWARVGEVEADAHRLGWSEADRVAAEFAWSEAKRPAVQRLPNVCVPGVAPSLPAPTPARVPPPGRAALARDELAPLEVSSHPNTDGYRPVLEKLYYTLAGRGHPRWNRGTDGCGRNGRSGKPFMA